MRWRFDRACPDQKNRSAETVALIFGVPVAGGNEADMLIRNKELGAALAKKLSTGTVVLMRGHGDAVIGQSIKHAVLTFATATDDSYIHLTVDEPKRLTWYAVVGGTEHFDEGVAFEQACVMVVGFIGDAGEARVAPTAPCRR